MHEIYISDNLKLFLNGLFLKETLNNLFLYVYTFRRKFDNTTTAMETDLKLKQTESSASDSHISSDCM